MNRARGVTKQPKIPKLVSSEIAPMSGPMYSAPPIELYQFLLQYLEAKFPFKCESKTIGGKKLHKAKVSNK